MEAQVYQYQSGDKTSIGYLALPDGNGERPGILVVHEAPGRDDHVKRRAEMLAGLGYVALAADLYGGGVVGNSPEEAFALMGPLREDLGPSAPTRPGRARRAGHGAGRRPRPARRHRLLLRWLFGLGARAHRRARRLRRLFPRAA